MSKQKWGVDRQYFVLKNHEKGLSTHLKNEEVINSLSKYKLRKAIFEEFNVLWQLQIPKFPKADAYKLFKTRVKLENDLIDNNNRKHRVAFIKLRPSDHNLMIEKGRHRRPITPREYRFCPHCPLQVENEMHFLTTCNIYEGRSTFFNEVVNHVPNFNNLRPVIFEKNWRFWNFNSEKPGDLTKKLEMLKSTLTRLLSTF